MNKAMNKKEQIIEIGKQLYKDLDKLYHTDDGTTNKYDIKMDKSGVMKFIELFATAIDNLYRDEKTKYHDVEEFYKVEPDKLPNRDEWISVEDRLPKFDKRVIVAFIPKSPIMEIYDYTTTKRIDISLLTQSQQKMVEANGFPRYVGNVTHWMPLPEPPKQQK